MWDHFEFIEGELDPEYPVYIVDSFSTPHSFEIFNVTKTPTLVKYSCLNGSKTVSMSIESYLPNIYKQLGLED